MFQNQLNDQFSQAQTKAVENAKYLAQVAVESAQELSEINQAALEHLPKGGILFTFSCSQVVDRHMFDNMLLSAAVNAGKRIQILHKLRQPADHPVNLAHPEGEYLKGLAVRVMD